MASATSVCTNTDITFTASATDPDGDPLSFIWNFSQTPVIMPGNQASVTVQFATAGTVNVDVSADDGQAQTPAPGLSITVTTGGMMCGGMGMGM